MIYKLFHYAQKVIAFGPKRSGRVVWSRIKDQVIQKYWRGKALYGNAAHFWQDIKVKNKLKSFGIFCESQRLRSLSFAKHIYAENKTKNKILHDAKLGVKNNLKIFQNLHQYTQIDWHADGVVCTEKSTHFDPNIFYKDIHISVGANKILEKDIKVPWERSRFYHFFVLGNAYQLSGDKKYVVTFTQQVTQWLDHNTYLLGVNWLCPMEVGLRAVNWVIAFSFFEDADIDPNFWQRFTCSLYDHFVYLENNWELYDSRTSNHYLSNLIGYVYLCWFFKDLNGVDKKLQWVHKEIIKEMEKQVFDEGTDYEGSTRYHQLVTELFYHAYLMFQECDLYVPQHFVEKLTRMFAFIEWCTPANGQLITIGDHDSGKVLYYGLPKSPHLNVEKKEGIQHFPKFGLSIIKNKTWHISLRHHAYHNYQPSGHFHNDVGSVTVAVNGIPVFVDPGSYVYTPSAYWRNTFRSVQVHNTCYIEGIEPVPLSNDLFYMDLPKKQAQSNFCVQHNLYQQYGLSFERNLVFENDTLKVTDEWSGDMQRSLMSVWSFTLGPNILPKKENGVWLLQHSQETLLTLSSDLTFELDDTWVSPEYGTKLSSFCLRAKNNLIVNTPTHIYLSLP